MAGNAFVHCELSADDLGAAKKFYKKLFDWKLSDMGPEMGNYTLIDVGKKTSGGGMAVVLAQALYGMGPRRGSATSRSPA